MYKLGKHRYNMIKTIADNEARTTKMYLRVVFKNVSRTKKDFWGFHPLFAAIFTLT